MAELKNHESRAKEPFVVEGSQKIFVFLKAKRWWLLSIFVAANIAISYFTAMTELKLNTSSTQATNEVSWCGGPQEFKITKTSWTVITVKEGCRVIGSLGAPLLLKNSHGEEILITPGEPNPNLQGIIKKMEFKLPKDSPNEEIKLALEFPPI